MKGFARGQSQTVAEGSFNATNYKLDHGGGVHVSFEWDDEFGHGPPFLRKTLPLLHLTDDQSQCCVEGTAANH